MPVFDYECRKCGAIYDLYHKTADEHDEVLCPVCGSNEHKRLISVPGVAKFARPSESPRSSGGGCCGGGQCGLN